MDAKMNHSGVRFNGLECVVNKTWDTKKALPESSASPAGVNLVTSSTDKVGNNVRRIESISPEKAKKIKEEVLEMQKKRFKVTSPRKRKSDSEKCKLHFDFNNKSSPSKCTKTCANSSPSNRLSDKVPNMCLDKEIVRICQTAPGFERTESESHKHVNGVDKQAKKINVETSNATDSFFRPCINKNMSEPSSFVTQLNNVNVTPCTSKAIIFVDLAADDDDDDDDFQKSVKKPVISENKTCKTSDRLSVNKESKKKVPQKAGNDDDFQKSVKKPFISEGKTCKTSDRLSVNKELKNKVPQKAHNLSIKTSKYLNKSSVSESPLNINVESNKLKANIPFSEKGAFVQPFTENPSNLSVKNNELKANIPLTEKGPFVQHTNNSGNVLREALQKVETFPVNGKLSECVNKVQYNQLSGASANKESNNLNSVGSVVVSPIISSETKQVKTNEKKQQESETKGSIFSENLLNETIKLSQKISQQPKKFAVKSTSTTNGLQLVMAAGGSAKKKSPNNRLGKNSPIKLFKSSYSESMKQHSEHMRKLRKNLFIGDSEEDIPPNNTGLFSEKYVQHFLKILLEVLDNNQNKNLVRDELVTVGAFMQLEEDAKKLYVRMLARKFKWHRVPDIHYEEVPCIEETLLKLESAGFVESDYTNENLEDMLYVLKVQELKDICKELKIYGMGNKTSYVNSLMEFGKNQKSVCTSSTIKVLWKSVKSHLGHCIRLCSSHRDAIQRLLTLFSITHQDNATDRELSRLLSLMHFVESNRIVYPSYTILRTRPIFASREDMFGHEVADKLLNDLLIHLQCRNWEKVCSLGKEAEECFRVLLQDEEKSKMAKQLPLFLRRYTPGSVYAYAITLAVEGFKKKKATLPDAVTTLRNLLNQHIYSPNYRGRWYDALALILHSHLHKTKQTAEVIIEALKDDTVNEEYQHSLSTRGSRLLKALKGNCTDLKRELETVLKEPMSDVPEVTIKARAVNSNLPGYRKVYIEEDVGETTFSSVEELVISRYKNEFPEAIHGEGSTMCTLFALFFWDIIYQEEVPDVFQNPYQLEPLDLTSGEFYTNRKEKIDQRLHDICEWSTEQLQRIVKEIFKQHEGKNSLVNWNRFRNVNQVMNVVRCIGAKVLSRILERFAKHYRDVRRGFPDLILWAPARNECLFLEVKGPKDRLSMSQKIWLHKLIEFGARAAVCHVQTTGSKMLKRKTPQASTEINASNPNKEPEISPSNPNKKSEIESICIDLSE